MSVEETTSQSPDLVAITRSYLDAFERRDAESCLAFFHDDASIDFVGGNYQGKDALTLWHQDRFDADLRITKVSGISARGPVVNVELEATSKRLAAWKVNKAQGRLRIVFEDDKIRHGKLTPRFMSPVDMMRQGQ